MIQRKEIQIRRRYCYILVCRPMKGLNRCENCSAHPALNDWAILWLLAARDSIVVVGISLLRSAFPQDVNTSHSTLEPSIYLMHTARELSAMRRCILSHVYSHDSE